MPVTKVYPVRYYGEECWYCHSSNILTLQSEDGVRLARICLGCGKFLDRKERPNMKTKEKPEIKEALEAAEGQYSMQTVNENAIFHMLKALTLAVCEVADHLNQIVADLPSHDS